MLSRSTAPPAPTCLTVARRLSMLGFVALAAGALACTPQVGDPCDRAEDCSPVGDLLCDTTQPGGYCTQFNCEPGRCADDSLCVAFRARESIELACDNPQTPSRFERSFCMATCEKFTDCRKEDGYICVDMNEPENLYGAVIVEENDSKGKVCVQPYSEPKEPPSGSTEVCTGNDEFDDPIIYYPVPQD